MFHGATISVPNFAKKDLTDNSIIIHEIHTPGIITADGKSQNKMQTLNLLIIELHTYLTKFDMKLMVLLEQR